jgi:hypothetical protein
MDLATLKGQGLESGLGGLVLAVLKCFDIAIFNMHANYFISFLQLLLCHFESLHVHVHYL